MLGSGESFVYFRCPSCRGLQISEVPEKLSAYYPAHYYSYQALSRHPLKRSYRKLRDRYLLQRSPLGDWLHQLRPHEALRALRQLRLHRQMRILDVGCGRGQLVQALREQGFRQSWGCDPFVEQAPAWVRPQALAQQEGGWDLIMYHHALEHLPQPLQSLQQAVQRLHPGGRLLVRVPTVDSWAYTHYGVNWVQWDPPRHLYLFSRQNLLDFGRQLQLQVQARWDDSSDFQFWGSEAYGRGESLPRPPALWRRLRWRRQANRLNAQQQGDQLVVVYQKPNH